MNPSSIWLQRQFINPLHITTSDAVGKTSTYFWDLYQKQVKPEYRLAKPTFIKALTTCLNLDTQIHRRHVKQNDGTVFHESWYTFKERED